MVTNDRVSVIATRPVAGPERLDVLLLDAEHRQSLAALRVLSRAGLRVGTAACESDTWWAPSMRSRFCGFRASMPDLSDDGAAYVAAVLRLLDVQPSRMLLPAHDGTIQALRSRRAEIEARTALPLASEAALDVATSKVRTLAVATELGLCVPQSLPVETERDLVSALKQVGLPAVLKPRESWVERDGKGVRLSPNAVQSMDEARELFERMMHAGGHPLIQPLLPGRREAVTTFYADGRVWARMAQRSYREWPVLGGASVLCETIPLLPDITRDAELLVQAIGLEGCSMVEFRRDREGRPVLMEVNPRMGGSVALAISAGVNFPGLLYDWTVNGRLSPVSGYRVGKRLRWLAGDVWNLKCAFEMQGHPDMPSLFKATATFLSDFVRPGNTLDGVEFGDMRPALAELNRLVFRHGRRRMRRIFSSNQLLLSEG